MIEGINEKNELSEYHYNSLGALIGETKLIAKDAYSYTGVDAQPTQSKRDPKYQKDKTSLIETQNTIDYTSELLDKLTETEQGGLTYKYVYGLDKLSVDISPTPPETTAATKTTKTTTPPAPTLYYYHQDRQGSIDSLTDNCACVKSSAGYDPWGKPKKSDPLKEGKRKLDLVTEYTTYAYDNVLNIYHAKARMYDAENRRFMAQDIVAGFQENPQTLNRYAYVINNPKSLTDSTGENLFGDILDGLKGIGDSLVDNLIIEPLKVGAKVWDYVAEMVTGKPSYVANSISKIQEKVEESRSENVNNEKWYYGGRMVGDVLSAAAGIVAMASGLTMMGEGLEVMFGGTAGGLTLAPKSGTISAIVGAVIDVAGAALVVEGAAVAGYGAVVTFKSMDNFQKNLQRFQAASEGSGGKADKRTAGEIISQEKKGSINQEFPSEWRNSTLEEIEKAARQGDKSAQKAKKLLKDKGFDKGSNSGRTKK
ncbi:MAG: hypothetical protein FWG14_06550 [Peptococcaceae bacterium]|nr:hypothetical protein [Peptococcaceae bacterium]